MFRRFRSLKVLAFAGVTIAALLVGEMSQAMAESFLADEETQLLGLVNQHRSERQLGQVSMNEALRMVARRQTQRMAMAGYIYHNDNLAADYDEAIPGWLALGENVGLSGSAAGVHDAFIRSPAHRENVEGAPYNIIGIGAVASSDGSQKFYTENFAKWSPGAPPPTNTAKTVSRPPTVTSRPRAVATLKPAPSRTAVAATTPVTEAPVTPAPTPPPTPEPTPAPTPGPESSPRAVRAEQASVGLPQGVVAMIGHFLEKIAFWR